MKLFHSPASPYVRKVMMVAHEHGLADQLTLLPSAANPVKRDPNIIAVNASGKVPCLVLEDGTAIFDSRVICQYLDSLAPPEASLYPAARRFEILTLEALCESMLDAALLCRYERLVRPEALFWADWDRGQMEKITTGLQDLNDKWFTSLSNGDFHAGAIAVVATLGYLDLRFAEIAWRDSHPKLAAWLLTISTRVSIARTAPQL